MGRPPGPPAPPSPRMFLDKHGAELGIGEETRQKIETIISRDEARGRELRDRLHAAHRKLRDLLMSDAPQVDAVMAQADKVGALELENRKLRLRAMLEVRALLTPEQRDTLKRKRDEWFSRKPPAKGPGAWVPPVCASDFESLCARTAEAGPPSACLARNREKLSSGCAELIERGERGRDQAGR